MVKVLVTTYKTASDRIALAAVRGLAKAGCEVWIGTDASAMPTCSSRFVKGVLPVRSPIETPDEHVDDVRALVARHKFATVMPSDDYAVYALSKSLEQDKWEVPLPVPALDAQMSALSKVETTLRAQRLSILTPKSRAVSTASELDAALEQLRPPWVIKLARGGGSVGMEITDDPNLIRNMFSDRPSHSDTVYDFQKFIVQEFIKGKTHDAWVLMQNGRAVCGLAGRRHLTWPFQGGGGVIVETIARPDYFDDAVRLLEDLKWHGPADVEFIVSEEDGRAYFIEINGRLWGNSALAIHAGVNFPALACAMAVDDNVEPDFAFPEKIRMRWPFPNGFLCIANGPNKLSLAWNIFRPSFRHGSDVWLTDPIPAWRQARAGLAKLRGRPDAPSFDPRSR